MKQILPFIITLCLLISSCGLKPKEGQQIPFKYEGYETSDTNYFKGQVLKPDQIHNQTLIVVNADSLNWCMAYYDSECDGDLQDILRAYCDTLPLIK